MNATTIDSARRGSAIDTTRRGSAIDTTRRGSSSRRARRVGLGWRGLELLLAAALLSGLGVLHVLPRIRAVGAGYALSAQQSEHARLQAVHDQLRIELGMLTRPAELARRVKDARLGMAPPDRGAVWAGGSGVGGEEHASGPAEHARFALAESVAARGN